MTQLEYMDKLFTTLGYTTAYKQAYFAERFGLKNADELTQQERSSVIDWLELEIKRREKSPEALKNEG